MVINQAPPPIPVRSPVVNVVSQRPAPSSPSRSPSATSERKKSTEKSLGIQRWVRTSSLVVRVLHLLDLAQFLQ